MPSQRVSATNSAICQSKAPASGTFKVYQFCLAGVSRASGAFLYPRASGTFKNRYLRDYVSASLSAIVKTDKMQHRLTARRPFRRNNSAAQTPEGGGIKQITLLPSSIYPGVPLRSPHKMATHFAGIPSFTPRYQLSCLRHLSAFGLSYYYLNCRPAGTLLAKARGALVRSS